MNITQIVWNKVEVTCEQDPSKNESLQDVRITFKTDPPSLTLAENKPESHSVLYARPAMVSLTPWSASFTAFWWSSRFESDDFDELIPVKVECQF